MTTAMAHPIGRAALEGFVRAAGSVAPGPTSAMVERAWFSPRRHAWPKREREALVHAEQRFVRTPAGRVAVWVWSPTELPWEQASTQTVLLVHGWEGRGSQLCAFTDGFLAQGFRVVGLDGPGHGASDGDSADAPAFAAAIAEVAAVFGDVRAVVAHSMGGAALALAHAEGLVVDAAVLIGTPCSLSAVTERFTRQMAFPEPLRAAFARRIEARLGADIWARADIPLRAHLLSASALVVHDEGDAEIPHGDGVRIAQAWPGAELHTTHGLGHRRILRDPAVVARATDFVGAALRRAAL